jgi:hypothetical protein
MCGHVVGSWENRPWWWLLRAVLCVLWVVVAAGVGGVLRAGPVLVASPCVGGGGVGVWL